MSPTTAASGAGTPQQEPSSQPPSQSGGGQSGAGGGRTNANYNNSSNRGGGRGRQQHQHHNHQHHVRASVSGRGIVDQGPSGSGGPPKVATKHTFSTTDIAPSSGVPYGYVPAYLPGSASLVEQLDQRLLIVLRDGRHLVGIFRSFDQFSNMVLEHTSERRVWTDSSSSSSSQEDAGKTFYADVPLGLYVVRGDSMVLMGQITNDDETTNMIKLSPEELEDKKKKAQEEKEKEQQQEEEEEKELEWDFDNDLVA
mmetsp:Transcript_10475/g.14850  ORF Transcript_10475/g.14850 Transcript_10475/m.14850 type:complete len:254 (+) Transcript_10475:348-1109(+)